MIPKNRSFCPLGLFTFRNFGNGSTPSKTVMWNITLSIAKLPSAFVHRDGTWLGRVGVQLDNDGMTVSNPGGFIEGVTIKKYFNSWTAWEADALKRIGLAERSGRGGDRIFEGSLQYGRPLPEYLESTSTNIKLYMLTDLPDKQDDLCLFVPRIRKRKKLAEMVQAQV